MLLLIEFIICTSVIVYAGTRLSKYGDIIAEKTGLGKTWIGVILMASVTSLPELVTGISSVTYAGVPDIAVGDVIGSCVFNMSFIAMRLVYFYEKKQISLFIQDMAAELKYKGISTKTAILNFCVNAVFVVIAAIFLPKIGEGIAESTGLGQTFVGNIFIAISTSLPELVVCIAAVKIDAVDFAIGNLFGSNVFNIFILAIDDFLFTKGPLLSFVNQNHIISAVSAIAMTTTAIIGLTYRAERNP